MNAAISLGNLFTSFTVPVIAYTSKNNNLRNQEIHELRVAIKNITAVLELTDKINRSHLSKQYKSILDPVFKEAGRIRALDMNLDMINRLKTKKFAAIRKVMRGDKQKHVSNFRVVANEFHKKQFLNLNGELLSQLDSIKAAKLKKDGNNFIKEKLRETKDLLKSVNKNDDLHAGRKNLKTVKTVLQVFEAMYPDKGTKKKLKKITAAENLIGEWHDRTSLARFIRKYLSDYCDKKNKKIEWYYKILKDEIKGGRKKISKSVLNILDHK